MGEETEKKRGVAGHDRWRTVNRDSGCQSVAGKQARMFQTCTLNTHVYPHTHTNTHSLTHSPTHTLAPTTTAATTTRDITAPCLFRCPKLGNRVPHHFVKLDGGLAEQGFLTRAAKQSPKGLARVRTPPQLHRRSCSATSRYRTISQSSTHTRTHTLYHAAHLIGPRWLALGAALCRLRGIFPHTRGIAAHLFAGCLGLLQLCGREIGYKQQQPKKKKKKKKKKKSTDRINASSKDGEQPINREMGITPGFQEGSAQPAILSSQRPVYPNSLPLLGRRALPRVAVQTCLMSGSVVTLSRCHQANGRKGGSVGDLAVTPGSESWVLFWCGPKKKKKKKWRCVSIIFSDPRPFLPGQAIF